MEKAAGRTAPANARASSALEGGSLVAPSGKNGVRQVRATRRTGEGARLYKGLGPRAESMFGGSAQWSLPRDQRPGAWMPPITRLCPGLEGYHIAPTHDLLRHWLAPRLFVAEGRGGGVLDGTVLVCREARLVRELCWDIAVALQLYRDCLALAVGEARRHCDVVGESRHQRVLADAQCWRANPRWSEVVRLGLTDLASATGGIWHRAERRRRDPERHPLCVHIGWARDQQVRRFLEHLDDRASNEQVYRHT